MYRWHLDRFLAVLQLGLECRRFVKHCTWGTSTLMRIQHIKTQGRAGKSKSVDWTARQRTARCEATVKNLPWQDRPTRAASGLFPNQLQCKPESCNTNRQCGGLTLGASLRFYGSHRRRKAPAGLPSLLRHHIHDGQVAVSSLLLPTCPASARWFVGSQSMICKRSGATEWQQNLATLDCP